MEDDEEEEKIDRSQDLEPGLDQPAAVGNDELQPVEAGGSDEQKGDLDMTAMPPLEGPIEFGKPKQGMTRAVYRPSPHRKGRQ